MDNPFISPAVLSLCPGMLGLERGIARVISGIRTVAYVEIEAFVVENLVQQMEQGVLAAAPVHTDVKTFPFEIFRDKIHWIIGGYPCQPFSHAGLRGGANDPRHLWPFIARGIKKSRPVGVFFENVEGHLSLGLRDVLTDLRKLGYQTEVGLYSAAEVGAPHRRNRTFILGLENTYLLGDGRRDLKRILTTPSIAIPAKGSGQLGYPQRGRSESRDDNGQETEIIRAGCYQLDHANSFRSGSEHQVPTGGNSAQLPSEGMANPNDLGQQQFEGVLGESGQRVDNGDQELGNTTLINAGTRTRENGEVQSGGSGVDDTSVPRCETERQFQPRSGQGLPLPVGRSRQDWPAKPGQPQHQWEAPRLESSLGYAINGYNFREDLLRMAGNAVVEQQAEKAFRELLMKFL